MAPLESASPPKSNPFVKLGFLPVSPSYQFLSDTRITVKLGYPHHRSALCAT
jgi:hypothetical protein